jgi:hypothetical protein
VTAVGAKRTEEKKMAQVAMAGGKAGSGALSAGILSFTFGSMRDSFHPIPFFFLMRHATRLLLPLRGH